jgi:alanyl-tRNA synthetase
MQYLKTENGFEPLKQKNVDFGGGLERMSAAVLGNPDVFRISLFSKALSVLENLTGKSYESELTSVFRVVLDHLRAAVFLVSDGVIPSNKTQGYVLRRLVRRSLVVAREFEMPEAWISKVCEAFIETYSAAYPELSSKKEFIVETLSAEEKKFASTLNKGLKEFEKLIAKQGTLSGADAFNLYQTFGFPWEVSCELALKQGVVVDRAQFSSEFEKHQNLSRTASSGEFKGGLGGNSPQIVAYHTTTHLLHKALKMVLGDSVVQKGSNITEERLRFDFAWGAKLTDEQKTEVESLVRSWIERGLEVKREEVSFDEAVKRGAIGLFGEKYGELVSIYTIFDPKTNEVVSLEFCGGPHVNNTSEIGTFKIVKE